MKVGDTVQFRPGREGTFTPGAQLVVKEVGGDPVRWFVADVGRTEWFFVAERVEVVEECAEQSTS